MVPVSRSEIAEAMTLAWEAGDVESFHKLSAQFQAALWQEPKPKQKSMAPLLAVLLLSYLILDLSDGHLGTIDFTAVPSFVWLFGVGGFALVRQVYF